MKHALLLLLLLTASCFAQTSGQWRMSKRNADGTYTDYGVTLANGQVITLSGGVPAALTPFDGSFASLSGTPTTLAGYGITDAITAATAAATYAPIAHNQAWSTITSTPTTLAGYGITDAITAATAAATYEPLITVGSIALNKLATDPLARSNHTGTQAWSTLTGTPTTLAGYGITDAITAATAASTYQPLSATLTTLSSATAAGLALMDDADAAAQRTTLGLVIGTNVQAYDADLTTYASITPSTDVQTLLGAADNDEINAQLGQRPLVEVSGNTTLETGKRYLVKPTSSYTLTLPNSGVVPMMTYIDLVRSTDAWSAAPLTIDANGGTITGYSGGAQSSLELYNPGWSPEPYAVYRLTCVSLEIIGTFPSMTTIYHWQASIINAVPMSAATQAALRAGVGQTGGLAAYTATPTAYSLQSATTTVNVSSATAPTSGQVLTATSGTAATWQTPSGGGSGAMVFLGEFTATAASQLNIDNVFDNALYDHYVMSGHVTPATNNVNLLIGLRSSVPADSTEIYSQGYLSGRLDTSGSASGGAAAWVLFAAAANYRADIIRLVYRPADGTSYHRLAGDFAFTAINGRYGYQTNGEFQGTTARAGLRFYFSAGNLTGTIRIWGVKKS